MHEIHYEAYKNVSFRIRNVTDIRSSCSDGFTVVAARPNRFYYSKMFYPIYTEGRVV